jgi:hypothetical protein
MKIVFSIAVLGASIAGCSGDPKAATEKNFETAIQKFLDRQGPECFIRQAKFPVNHTAFGDEDGLLKSMSALKAAGLVDIKEIEVKEVRGGFGLPSDKMIKQRKLEILLTDTGQKAFTEQQQGEPARRSGGFCFGKQKVVKVEQFTEPSDALGMKMSQVNFTYRVDDVPAWAKHESLGKQFPQLAKAVASAQEPLRSRTAVILTNQGWIHERDMNRP